ncbi:MAG: hypothetical protein MUO53_08500, partial [Maribacter sp.]|nr:hypothetical protein [Maribacter sp.]
KSMGNILARSSYLVAFITKIDCHWWPGLPVRYAILTLFRFFKGSIVGSFIYWQLVLSRT